MKRGILLAVLLSGCAGPHEHCFNLYREHSPYATCCQPYGGNSFHQLGAEPTGPAVCKEWTGMGKP